MKATSCPNGGNPLEVFRSRSFREDWLVNNERLYLQV